MYQGMTIHNLLEKVDLLNFMFDEDSDGNTKAKESSPELSKTISISSDPTSAYLGELINLKKLKAKYLLDRPQKPLEQPDHSG